MAPGKNLLTILLIAGTGLCLLQVWLPGYYLTCDGPCHLYNAGIVQDLWNGQNTSFYGRFFHLVYNADPNSLTTFALAALLYVARGAMAEKLFLSLYIIGYVAGFAALLRRLGAGNSWWLLCVLLFPFNFAFAKGFYNYSFSIAGWSWLVWSWLGYLDKGGKRDILLFFLFCCLTYFTHLLPFVFGLFACSALLLSHTVAGAKASGTNAMPALLRKGGVLLACALPFLLLMFVFTQGEGGLQLRLGFFPYRLIELLEFKYLISLTETERVWALAAGLTLTVLMAAAAIAALPARRLHKYDGLALALLFIGLVYVLFPEQFLGHMIVISIRVQLFVFIVIACIVAYRLPEGKLKTAGALVLATCFVALSVCRMACMGRASEALNDYLSAGAYIRPGAVVLPLDFSPVGRDAAGKEIANRNSIFHHASHYLAAGKPLIMLDNYEANMGYFPIRWQAATNPYNHLSAEAGIEGLPPFARIASYKQQAGVTIDYVLLWCYQPHYRQDSRFNELYEELNRMYHAVYTSPGRRTILYEKNREGLAAACYGWNR